MPPWYAKSTRECWVRFDYRATQADPWEYWHADGMHEVWLFPWPGGLPDPLPDNVREGYPAPSPICGVTPGEGISLPRLEKPHALESFLEFFNWEILGIIINPGEAVEAAIDWIIEVINSVLELIESAINFLYDLPDKISQLRTDLTRFIEKEISPIWNAIRNIPDKIDQWWSGTKHTVMDWIEMAGNSLLGLIANIGRVIDALESEWNYFWRYTLPDLLPKWEIEALIRSALAEWADLFNFWGDSSRKVIEFFTDPLQWLYNKIDEWFERFW